MRRSLPRVARTAAVLAGLAGAYGVLDLLGAFGPVSCWTGRSASGTNASNGSGEQVTTATSRGCTSGIDALFGAGGNAPVLFSWALVLLVLVAVGAGAAWTGHRYVTWSAVGVGAVVTVLGAFSIGWFFLLPTLFLLVAAAALSVDARRAD